MEHDNEAVSDHHVTADRDARIRTRSQISTRAPRTCRGRTSRRPTSQLVVQATRLHEDRGCSRADTGSRISGDQQTRFGRRTFDSHGDVEAEKARPRSSLPLPPCELRHRQAKLRPTLRLRPQLGPWSSSRGLLSIRSPAWASLYALRTNRFASGARYWFTQAEALPSPPRGRRSSSQLLGSSCKARPGSARPKPLNMWGTVSFARTGRQRKPHK